MVSIAGVSSALAAKCPDDGTVLSLQGGVKVDVAFVNNSGGDLALFWIDFSGKRKFYRAMKPGERALMNTVSEHVWFAEKAGGVCWPAFVVPRQNMTHTFNP